MKARRQTLQHVRVAFAANPRGDGLAYVRTADGSPLRVPFRVERSPALLGHEVGYAALLAVSAALRAKGMRAVRIGIADARIVDDLTERRALPAALALPYVRLRCALNTFARAEVVATPEDEELSSRARAEVELAVAA
ncbi:MAG: hypothetical protein JO359_09780 [Candidatus Eremiobacteraeota bacterium]|nr:hypothetical protein [Candidatus Eremiobacteraeota bacterium]